MSQRNKKGFKIELNEAVDQEQTGCACRRRDQHGQALANGEESQIPTEPSLEDHRQPKRGKADEEKRQYARDVIGQAIAVHGGDNAGRHAEQGGDDDGGGGQLEGGGPEGAQGVNDGSASVERFTPIAAEESGNVIDVLDRQGLVKAEFAAEGFFDFFGGAGTCR